MTKHEQTTIDSISRKLDAYIKADDIWKAGIEEQLKPLTDDRFDRIVVSKYSRLAFKVAAGVIAFFISVLVLVNMTMELLNKK